jgi:FkbM family methyltransferase
MQQVARRALLGRLREQASLSHESRVRRLQRLPWRLVLPRLLNGAGATRRVTARTFFDRKMQVHLPDLVGVKLYQYGFFEEGLTRAIVEALPEDGVFIDIGAHVGYYSLLASILVGARGRVVAFEPTPRTCAELKDNTAGLDNVTVVSKAAWDGPARLTLRDFGWQQSSFNSVMAPRVTKDVQSTAIEVDAIAIDDWLETHRIVPNFIKIDAESAEHRVLGGLRRTLERHRPLLSLEVGDYSLPGVPSSATLINSVTELGYQPWQYVEGAFVPHHVGSRYQYDNLIFVPVGGSVPQGWPNRMS